MQSTKKKKKLRKPCKLEKATGVVCTSGNVSTDACRAGGPPSSWVPPTPSYRVNVWNRVLLRTQQARWLLRDLKGEFCLPSLIPHKATCPCTPVSPNDGPGYLLRLAFIISNRKLGRPGEHYYKRSSSFCGCCCSVRGTAGG